MASWLDEGNIFENAAKAKSVVNFWFGLWLEVDGFGVTATLKVKDASGRPTVLIVAYQLAARISREGGFASA